MSRPPPPPPPPPSPPDPHPRWGPPGPQTPRKTKPRTVLALLVLGVAAVLALVYFGVLDDGPPPKRDAGGQVTEEGSSDTEDVRKGDCFTTDDDLTKKKDADAGVSVRVVPCDQPHEGEAYAVFTLEDGPYPGKEKIVRIATEKCGSAALTAYTGDAAKLPRKMEPIYNYPQSSTWDLGERNVICFLGDPTGKSTGSVRAPGSEPGS
ncbi:septum formation family protein [Streptomyces sp. NPDC044571]|uniref:septum formation family protein n=1 Tax=Streptomyces sp. NPDC044571 TaxID=3155371 RepID=UPI0033ED3141